MRSRLKPIFFQFISAVVLLTMLSFITGCFGPNSTDGAVIGGATGAGAGAIAGSATGQTGAGAAGGAAAGAVIGGMTGSVIDADEQEKENKKKRDQMLEFQQKEFDRQRREIEDLRRQQYHDEEFRRKYPEQEAE